MPASSLPVCRPAPKRAPGIRLWRVRIYLQAIPPPDAVWKVWTDVARWPEWDVSKEIAQLNGPFERGACGWAKQRGNLSGSFTITEIHLLEPVARGLCPGGQEVEVQGGSGPLIRLSAPKMRRDIAESLAALQRLLSR